MKAQNKKNKLLNKEVSIDSNRVNKTSKALRQSKTPLKENLQSSNKTVNGSFNESSSNKQSVKPVFRGQTPQSKMDSGVLVKSKESVIENLQGGTSSYKNVLNNEGNKENFSHPILKPIEKGFMSNSKVLRNDKTLVKEKLQNQGRWLKKESIIPMNQLEKYSKVPKREILQAKSDGKILIKEGVTSQQNLAPKQARTEARQDFKVTKKEYKLLRKDVRSEKLKLENATISGKKLTSEELKGLRNKKTALNRAKMNKNIKKKLHKHSVRNDPTAVRNQVKTESKARVKQDLKNQMTRPLQQEDTVGETINLIQQKNQAKMQMRQALKLTKLGGKLTVKTAKGTYGLGNKTYNLVRGKGFYRTPPHLTTRAELMKKARRSQRRLMAFTNKKKFQAGFKVNKIVTQVNKAISAAVKVVATNPITWIVLGFICVCLLIVGVASGSQYAINQTEEDLTDSWVYMTKEDAKHNDDSNTFYTNFNDVMFYMNYRFEDYKISEKYSLTQSYEKYLSTMWTKLNGSSPDYEITSMDSLIKNKKSSYYLKKDDYNEYKEYKDEYGYLSLDGQLSFPFKTKELTITKRFGYEGKGNKAKLFDKIVVKSEAGKEIVAPMSGVISKVTGTDSLEIKLSKDHKIILYGVKNSRFVGGETVNEGTYLGKGTDTTLSIKYFSYQTEEARWKAVNPAFYFPKVIYTQETLLGSDYDSMSLSPQVTALIPKFKEAMKQEGMPEKYLPIVLAVCMQESGGRVTDVMQSSESLGLPRNSLSTDASIRQGVRYIWENMRLIGLELINRDEKYIKTAVQSYNCVKRS